MPYFGFSYAVPNLPPYLFEADLVSPIIPPLTFTAVPTTSQSMYLHWSKHNNTTDTGNTLYAEVYRSTDLQVWEKVAVRQWLNYDYYTDTDVEVGFTYYYRIRFVRLDVNGTITNTSEYTETKSGLVVSALGFEPGDSFSNKFLQYLISNLPGTRVYDHTDAAGPSANINEWQTTTRMLEGFTVFVGGSVEHTDAADATALYAKRPINFRVTKRQTQIWGQTESGTVGPQMPVNSYLIYTFLWGYARQFLAIYETYLQMVADKYIDYSQVYTKGHKPIVSSRLDPTLATLYQQFGQLLRLRPLKAENPEQALNRYRQVLQASFGNQDNTGEWQGIDQAVKNVLGTTTHHILEYCKYHWFKTDRECKMYVRPSAGDGYWFATGLGGANNDLRYELVDPRYSAFIEYVATGISSGGWIETVNNSAENPFTYLFRVHISSGVTTANDVYALMLADPVTSTLLSVTQSGGDTGLGVISESMAAKLLRMKTRWLGWEDTKLNLYGSKLELVDTTATTSATDTANFSVGLSAYDPNYGIPPKGAWPVTGVTETNLGLLDSDDLPIVRDDDNGGVLFDTTIAGVDKALVGHKRVLFKLSLTSGSDMTQVAKAYLKIFVRFSNKAGYLRLYRIKKQYDTANVCWNFLDKETVTATTIPSPSFYWDGSDYVPVDSDLPYITANWQTAGAQGDEDAVLVKEFYLPEITNPGWVTLEVTDVMNQIYKYETAHFDMGDDPQNVITAGFMLTADGYEDRAIVIMKGHTDVSFKPQIAWTRFANGFANQEPDRVRYYYVDGTTRYGRLLVMQSAYEPLSYIRTVHERIRQQDIRYSSDFTLTLSTTAPAGFVVGERLYGQTSGAAGTISSVSGPTVYITPSHKTFVAGETLNLLSDSLVTATLSSVSYVGNKYVRLSRMPVSGSILRVYHTGVGTVAAMAPDTYPGYTPYTEGGDGIAPYLVANPVGTYNSFATQDSTVLDVIYLNSADAAATIGDVVVTYQYFYDFVLLGRVATDSDSVSDINACSRVGKNLLLQTEYDYLYRTELLLPKPSTGETPDVSGSGTDYQYSDHNLEVLVQALRNVRRLEAPVDVFKYLPNGLPYQVGHSYHSFFERA